MLPWLLPTAHELVFVSTFASHVPPHSISYVLILSLSLLSLNIFVLWIGWKTAVRFGHLPWHHAAEAGPSSPAHQETHCWVCDGVPGPAHKQDDRGMKGIQLKKGEREKEWDMNANQGECQIRPHMALLVKDSPEPRHQWAYWHIMKLSNYIQYKSSDTHNYLICLKNKVTFKATLMSSPLELNGLCLNSYCVCLIC